MPASSSELRNTGCLKGSDQIFRPRPPEEPVVRFETAPGRQGQVDFAHFRLPWGKRYALIVVLGYSSAS